MTMKLASAPCCWGVDHIDNPHLPPWERVLDEAAQAGYSGIELGPYGYLPLDSQTTRTALTQRGLSVVAGTIFDDLVSASRRESLIRQTHDICGFLARLPQLPRFPGQHFPAPYLVVIDHVHPERSLTAGHAEAAPRLETDAWKRTMEHITTIGEIARQDYGIRAVVHPHAGGYIEFDDEIRRLLDDVPYETAGLCMDTGHLYYSGMDPASWLREFAQRVDYLHFKNIDLEIHERTINQRIDFFDACAQGVMCPLDRGLIDYRDIRKILQEIDYQGYITIEQERDPRHASGSLNDVTASLEFLKTHGFNA